MASDLVDFCKAFVLFTFFFSSFHIFAVRSVEFEVGGDDGWVIPPPKNDQLFNDWASKKRFKLNDTLIFEYNKDSVLVVTEEEYEKCRSPHPLFFSNNGNTKYILERPGLFYFISGVSGHCERGLKIIIKVLEPPETPPQTANQSTGASPNSGVVLEMAAAASSLTLLVFIVSLFGALHI